MADYAIITNHTDYGMELIKSDPSMASNLASQTNTEVRNGTGGNYGISSVYIDFDNNLTYYDLEPLTVSAQEDMRLLSLGTPRVGLWDYIKKIIAVVLAVVALVIGALVGGWGFLVGAIIAGAILLWSYLTSRIEYKQEIADINQEYARQYTNGEITKEQYDNFVAAKEKVMTTGISWQTIVIGALIGFGVLAAFYFYITQMKKS